MRPTSRGIGAVLAGTALIAAGFTFGYPELAVVGVTALLAAACAVGYAALRPHLSVRRAVDPDRVTRGEPCTQTLTIGNSSRWRAATLVAQDRCGGARVPVPLVRLRPAQDTEVSYPVPTIRRGVVDVGPLRVVRRDPLGLVQLARSHGGTARVWVHPRWYPMGATPTGVTRSLDGRIDRVPHGSITFDKLREYVLGDELRHVHWRTTARIGQLMVREHVDTSLPRLVVLLDDRAAAYPGTGRSEPTEPTDALAAPGVEAEGFEAACEAAASIIAAATRADLPIELLLVSGEAGSTDPGAGAAAFTGGRLAGHAGPLLDRLAEANLIPEGRRPSGARPAGEGPAGGQARGDQPASGAEGESDSLAGAVNRLRQYRLGDTLVYLTGAGRIADLASVGALRGGYPTLIAGVFGDPEQVPEGVPGMHLFTVADAPAFAAAWDGMVRW